MRPVWLHIVCYRDQAVDQHRDPNNRVLSKLCGLGIVEERREWGVGDAGLYQLFFWRVLLEPTKGTTEMERECVCVRESAARKLLASHRLRGNGDFPNRWNKYYLAVDSNLSLSTTVVYVYKR